MKNIRVLAVDQYEMTAVGYQYIIKNVNLEDYEIHVDTATSYDEAKSRLESSLIYDVILLELKLSNNTEKSITDGEALGLLARKIMPESKVVYITAFDDSYRINAIMKSVNPDGYMIKSETDRGSLKRMIETILTSPPYYSHKVLRAIRKNLSNSITIDEIDQKILYRISLGTKTKDLVKYIALSASAIEYRKRQLKMLFGIERSNDQALLKEAMRRGFI